MFWTVEFRTANFSGRTGRITFAWQKILLRSLGNFCLPWIVVSKLSFDRHLTLVDFLLYKLYEWKKPVNVKLANTQWDHISLEDYYSAQRQPHQVLSSPAQLLCDNLSAGLCILEPKAAGRRLGSPSLSHSGIVRGQEVFSTPWVTYCWQQILKRGNFFLAWRDRTMRMGETRMCWDGQN